MLITLIIGMPGSGKTHLANELHRAEGGLVIDDIVGIEQLPDVADKLIITDVNFCDAKILATAKEALNVMYPNATIDCIYFENDAEKCRRNVVYRNDGRYVDGTIQRFEKTYVVPFHIEARKIWTVD